MKPSLSPVGSRRHAAVVAWVAGLFFALGCLASSSGELLQPQAQGGRLDLRAWSLAEKGPVELRGEWALEWHDPEGRTSATETVRVPSAWPIPDGAYWITGAATYRLDVLLPPETEPTLTLRFATVSTAYELRVDGELVGGVGTFGFTDATSAPGSAERVFHVTPQGDVLEIEVRVSNFDFRTGGLRRPIELGLPGQLEPTRDTRLARALFFVGAFLILAFYHLLIFALRRDIRAALYFALLSLTTSGHLLIVDNDVAQGLIPGLGWHAALILEYSFFTLIGLWSALFLHSLFPHEVPRRGVQALSALGVLLVGSLYVTPTTFSSGVTLRIVQVLVVLTLPYVLVKVGQAARAGRPGAALYLAGACVFVGAGVLDVLSSLSPSFFDQMPRLVPFGFLVFLLCQAALLARSVAAAYARVHELSDRLLGLDRLKDELLANTSHELRAPLYGMIGIADSLRQGAEGGLSGRVRGQLGMIVESGERLSRMVDDVLDFSQMRTSELTLERSLCSLHEAAEIACARLGPRAEEKRLQLQQLIPADFPGLDADPDRLQQIVLNLASNAIEATESGGVTLTASHDQTTATLRVIDTGLGLDAGTQERLFQPFETGSEPSEAVGPGLGLAIARELARLHGGDVTFRTWPGQGTTFYVSLPLAGPETPAAEEPRTSSTPFDEPPRLELVPELPRPDLVAPDSAEVAPEVSTSGHEGTVLIVDSDAVHRTVLVNHLRTAGYAVVTASTGTEALRQMSHQPDLVVLDVMTPQLNGYDLCRQLRQRFPANELPILFLTARNRPSDVVLGLKAGANDYIAKPVHGEELIARIASHVSVKRLTEERLRLELAVFKDSLTGLANRRGFDRSVEEHLREDGELSLLYLDLDQFKRINDDHGHDVGDRVLRVTAERLLASVRTGDVVARLGGDEFVVALRAGRKVARATAARIRSSLEEPIEANGEQIRVGASLGLATRDADTTSLASLLRKADEQMYENKRVRARSTGVA